MCDKRLDKDADDGKGQDGSGRDSGRESESLRWMSFGIELAGVMGVFGYSGYWADQKLGHGGPWLMLAGMAIGFVGMIYLLFKETAKWRK